MPNTVIIPAIEGESPDAPKKFRNIDNEPFDCTWDNILYTVQPGEMVVHQRPIVNYMAMHLARKMYKRKALAEFVGTEWEKANANIKLFDPEEELKLQQQMVADNFEQPKTETVPIIPEEKKEETAKEDSPFKCDKCEFIAKSKFGLNSHKRFKHK